ncbi:MAG: von Willebrand factor type A domain-containing protein [Verrucomicrobiales bacterium]|nr:von Willebrand factor type A domain-containing protein [Verrucomicrobiales bacterium]
MNEENLHSWMEPEFEARIIAMILGEASDFEKEETERRIKESPEATLFYKRMLDLHALLGTLPLRSESEENDWKLSTERREKLLATIGEPQEASRPSLLRPASTKSPLPKKGAKKRKIRFLPFAASIAASISLLGLVAVLVFGTLPGVQMASRPAMGTDSYAYLDDELAAEAAVREDAAMDMPSDMSFTLEASERSNADELNRAKSVSIEGNNRTKDRVIRESLPLEPSRPTITTKPAEAVVPASPGEATTPSSGENDSSTTHLYALTDGVVRGSSLSKMKRVSGSTKLPALEAPASNQSVATGNIGSRFGETQIGASGNVEMDSMVSNGTTAIGFPVAEKQQANRSAAQPPAAPVPAGVNFGRKEEVAKSESAQTFGLARNEDNYDSLAIDGGIRDQSREVDIVNGRAFADKQTPPTSNLAVVDPFDDTTIDLEQWGAGMDKKDSAPASNSLHFYSADADQDRNGVASEGRASIDPFAAPVEAGSGGLSSRQLQPSADPFAAPRGGTEAMERKKANAANPLGDSDFAMPKSALDGDLIASNSEEMRTRGIYYDEARDHTRARMFWKIKEGWETPAPPNKSVAADPFAPPVAHQGSFGGGGGGAPLEDAEQPLMQEEAESLHRLSDLSEEVTSLESKLEMDKSGKSPEQEAETVIIAGVARLQESISGEAEITEKLRSGSRDPDEAVVDQVSEAAEKEEEVRFTRDFLGGARELRGFDFRSLALDEKSAEEEPFSTFSLHVGDSSFHLARAALSKNQWPERETIRVEEFVNALDYRDPIPTHEEKVGVALNQARHPFIQQRNLLRISLATAARGRQASVPLRLTLLLDNSGSMERPDRRETVQRALGLLLAQLQETDEVTLISFARQPRLLADRAKGADAKALLDRVVNLPSEGGTNLEAALDLAFQKAQEQQVPNAQNRIILLTDGAANLGDAEPTRLAAKIETFRDAGIAFDAAGIGAQGLNDEILEALTRKGDGRYYLLDRPEDADTGFARQIAGALRPAAGNVKVQVEFNPDRVGAYQLIGFEKHRLKKEDFRNDAVDAAELAAAEAGVAVYQVEARPEGKGDIGSVSVRFRDLSTGKMVEKRWPILYDPNTPPFEQAAPAMRVAGTAAFLGSRLKEDVIGQLVELETLSTVLNDLPSLWKRDQGLRQLQEMVQKTRSLTSE